MNANSSGSGRSGWTSPSVTAAPRPCRVSFGSEAYRTLRDQYPDHTLYEVCAQQANGIVLPRSTAAMLPSGIDTWLRAGDRFVLGRDKGYTGNSDDWHVEYPPALLGLMRLHQLGASVTVRDTSAHSSEQRPQSAPQSSAGSGEQKSDHKGKGKGKSVAFAPGTAQPKRNNLIHRFCEMPFESKTYRMDLSRDIGLLLMGAATIERARSDIDVVSESETEIGAKGGSTTGDRASERASPLASRFRARVRKAAQRILPSSPPAVPQDTFDDYASVNGRAQWSAGTLISPPSAVLVKIPLPWARSEEGDEVPYLMVADTELESTLEALTEIKAHMGEKGIVRGSPDAAASIKSFTDKVKDSSTSAGTGTMISRAKAKGNGAAPAIASGQKIEAGTIPLAAPTTSFARYTIRPASPPSARQLDKRRYGLDSGTGSLEKMTLVFSWPDGRSSAKSHGGGGGGGVATADVHVDTVQLGQGSQLEPDGDYDDDAEDEGNWLQKDLNWGWGATSPQAVALWGPGRILQHWQRTLDDKGISSGMRFELGETGEGGVGVDSQGQSQSQGEGEGQKQEQEQTVRDHMVARGRIVATNGASVEVMVDARKAMERFGLSTCETVPGFVRIA